MNLNKGIRDFLVGTLLGDAHIRRTGVLKDKAYITFEQSIKKRDYINYLLKTSKEGGIVPEELGLTEFSRNDDRYNITNRSLYFRTESTNNLSPIADLFLNEENKKIVPESIADHLTPRSLAFWIMDDGQKVNRGGITLCTDSYNSNEINILREALKKNFNLDTTIHNKKGQNDTYYERIYIKKEGFEEIKPQLIPHMDDSMLYKLNISLTDKEVSESESEITIKQDSSGIVNDNIDLDIFDIGGS